MPAVVRLGDICTGHGKFPPRANDSAGIVLFTEGIAVHRQGDHWAIHCDPDSCHDSVLQTGSTILFAEGLPVGRIGDPVACGSTCATGSSVMFSN